jgi:hypothetical protein
VRTGLVLCTLAVLTACGVADTATSAAVGAKTKAREVEQAKATEQKAINDVQQAQQQADQRLREADK